MEDLSNNKEERGRSVHQNQVGESSSRPNVRDSEEMARQREENPVVNALKNLFIKQKKTIYPKYLINILGMDRSEFSDSRYPTPSQFINGKLVVQRGTRISIHNLKSDPPVLETSSKFNYGTIVPISFDESGRFLCVLTVRDRTKVLADRVLVFDRDCHSADVFENKSVGHLVYDNYSPISIGKVHGSHLILKHSGHNTIDISGPIESLDSDHSERPNDYDHKIQLRSDEPDLKIFTDDNNLLYISSVSEGHTSVRDIFDPIYTLKTVPALEAILLKDSFFRTFYLGYNIPASGQEKVLSIITEVRAIGQSKPSYHKFTMTNLTFELFCISPERRKFAIVKNTGSNGSSIVLFKVKSILSHVSHVTTTSLDDSNDVSHFLIHNIEPNQSINSIDFLDETKLVVQLNYTSMVLKLGKTVNESCTHLVA